MDADDAAEADEATDDEDDGVAEETAAEVELPDDDAMEEAAADVEAIDTEDEALDDDVEVATELAPVAEDAALEPVATEDEAPPAELAAEEADVPPPELPPPPDDVAAGELAPLVADDDDVAVAVDTPEDNVPVEEACPDEDDVPEVPDVALSGPASVLGTQRPSSHLCSSSQSASPPHGDAGTGGQPAASRPINRRELREVDTDLRMAPAHVARGPSAGREGGTFRACVDPGEA